MSLFGGRRKDGSSEATPPTVGGTTGAQAPATAIPAPPAAPAPEIVEKRTQPTVPARAVGGEAMANIGKSIVIKGDLSGEEDLIVEGKVEGRIHLPNHKVTIGQGGNVEAEVHAKAIVVIGRVSGNVSATERLEIQASGIVHGDVKAQRLVVSEGAVLNGSIEMSVKEPTAARPPAPAVQISGPVAASGGERRTG